ncbi:hypothetical protein [Burkholderia oklahomensis]|uniref:hypothetical protein n=2 Tax=Burkholderia oklahomensis TaxID=342113 RepID=UPI0009DA73AE|nr:hypothetical protein [Burkholderia oklahomensis]QPS40285.1 hypothetical protein I6G57_31515 [Burkholderia oklahomensis]
MNTFHGCKMTQLELLDRPQLSEQELVDVARDIRNLYWTIRNTRRGIQDAQRRRVYRRIEVHKKRLLVAGVPKAEILGLLRCCRASHCKEQSCFDCPKRRPKTRGSA